MTDIKKKVARRGVLALASLSLTLILASSAPAQEVRRFKFGYDTRAKTTAYGIAADIFADKLKQLSKGTMLLDQFPNAQLGTEAQTIELVKGGNVEMCIVATANAATIVPALGVISIHYLFKSEDHLSKVLADPRFLSAIQEMVAQKTDDLRVVGLTSLGIRSIYGRKEIKSIEDIKGLKARVMSTNIEDAMFAAYGAQSIHLPFQQVYTSLQTGVITLAENNPDNYLNNKHYEVGPVLSLTEHEPAISPIWMSNKIWQTLNDQQKQWVLEAAAEVSKTQPRKADELAHMAIEKMQKMGVKVVKTDKSGFIKAAAEVQSKLAQELGPQAVKLVEVIRSDE